MLDIFRFYGLAAPPPQENNPLFSTTYSDSSFCVFKKETCQFSTFLPTSKADFYAHFS